MKLNEFLDLQGEIFREELEDFGAAISTDPELSGQDLSVEEFQDLFFAFTEPDEIEEEEQGATAIEIPAPAVEAAAPVAPPVAVETAPAVPAPVVETPAPAPVTEAPAATESVTTEAKTEEPKIVPVQKKKRNLKPHEQEALKKREAAESAAK